MIVRLPAHYARLDGLPSLAVAHQQFLPAVRAILQQGTLFDWAAAHPERKAYQGRGPVYSAPLPDGGPRVVVRHARRGGALAPLLKDLYLAPTPAPAELTIASMLVRLGVPTPPVVGFATYKAAAGLLRRVDVMTIEVPGQDLAATLAADPTPDERALVRRAVARLLGQLLDAGAWHQDLNAKNILVVTRDEQPPQALALDVDRVRFVPAGNPHMRQANTDRLRRSMAKFRARGEAAFSDAEMDEVERLLHGDEAERATARATALEEYMPWA